MVTTNGDGLGIVNVQCKHSVSTLAALPLFPPPLWPSSFSPPPPPQLSSMSPSPLWSVLAQDMAFILLKAEM